MGAVLNADVAADTGTKPLGTARKKKSSSDPFKGLFHSMLTTKRPKSRKIDVNQSGAERQSKSPSQHNVQKLQSDTGTGIKAKMQMSQASKGAADSKNEFHFESAKGFDGKAGIKRKDARESNAALHSDAAAKPLTLSGAEDFQAFEPSPAGDIHAAKLSRNQRVKSSGLQPKTHNEHSGLTHESNVVKNGNGTTGKSDLAEGRMKSAAGKVQTQQTLLAQDNKQHAVSEYPGDKKRDEETKIMSALSSMKHPDTRTISGAPGRRIQSQDSAGVFDKSSKDASKMRNSQAEVLPNRPGSVLAVPVPEVQTADAVTANTVPGNRRTFSLAKSTATTIQQSVSSEAQKRSRQGSEKSEQKNTRRSSTNIGIETEIMKQTEAGQASRPEAIKIASRKSKAVQSEVSGNMQAAPKSAAAPADAKRPVSETDAEQKAASGTAVRQNEERANVQSKRQSGRLRLHAHLTSNAAVSHEHVRNKQHRGSERVAASGAAPDAAPAVIVTAPTPRESGVQPAQQASLAVQDHEQMLQTNDASADSGDFSSRQHDAHTASQQEAKSLQESQQTFKMQIRLNDVIIHARIRQDNLNVMINMRDGYGGVHEQHLGDEIQSILGDNGFKSYRLTIKEKSRKVYEHTENDSDATEIAKGQSGVSVKV